MSGYSQNPINVFWFRRDLRLSDNTGLWQALNQPLPVMPIFIFDSDILDKLLAKDDPRVTFIHHQLTLLHNELKQMGSGLQVYAGRPLEVFQSFGRDYNLQNVYCNHDYEPYAVKRDGQVAKYLSQQGAGFHSFKDQVIFEKSEVVKDDGKPYTVFTPYMKKWKHHFTELGGVEQLSKLGVMQNFLQYPATDILSLSSIGFKVNTSINFPEKQLDLQQIKMYHKNRDFPAIK